MDCLLVFGVIAFAVVSDQRGIFGVFVFALAVVIFPRCFGYSCVWCSKSVCVCVYWGCPSTLLLLLLCCPLVYEACSVRSLLLLQCSRDSPVLRLSTTNSNLDPIPIPKQILFKQPKCHPRAIFNSWIPALAPAILLDMNRLPTRQLRHRLIWTFMNWNGRIRMLTDVRHSNENL